MNLKISPSSTGSTYCVKLLPDESEKDCNEESEGEDDLSLLLPGDPVPLLCHHGHVPHVLAGVRGRQVTARPTSHPVLADVETHGVVQDLRGNMKLSQICSGHFLRTTANILSN